MTGDDHHLPAGASVVMRWAQRPGWGAAKWHAVLPDAVPVDYGDHGQAVAAVCGSALSVRWGKLGWKPEDRRPSMLQNNVCVACKKLFIASRPELAAALKLLADKKDI